MNLLRALGATTLMIGGTALIGTELSILGFTMCGIGGWIMGDLAARADYHE